MKLNPILRRAIVFSTEVEYGSDYTRQGHYLRPDDINYKQYELPSYESVKAVTKEVISDLLPKSMENNFELKTEIKILSIEPGSLTAFFSVLLTGFNVISNYKNFYDGIHLIRYQLDRILGHELRSRLGHDFEVNTHIRFPELPQPRAQRFDKFFHFGRHFLSEFEDLYQDTPRIKRRDGLFYYLLISNIILFALLGTLLFGAVKKTFFTIQDNINQRTIHLEHQGHDHKRPNLIN